MSAPARNAEQIIRRWKRLFLGTYVFLVLVVILLVFFSVLAAHCGASPAVARGKRIRAAADDPEELARCAQSLEALFTELHRETFMLQAKALRFNVDLAAEWRNWSEDWRQRWRTLDHRCRLSELAGQGVSREVDSMARIHGALDGLHLEYTSIVSAFSERHVDRLRRLREEVGHVRAMIERRKPVIPRGRLASPGASQ